jgi:hypothetical protein
MRKPIPVDSDFVYVAHRCLGFARPANSPEAAAFALASQADEIEVDVASNGASLYASHSPILAPWASSATALTEVLARWRQTSTRKGLRLDIKSTGVEETLLSHFDLASELPYLTFMSSRVQILQRLLQLNSHIGISLSVVLTGISIRADKARCARAVARLKGFSSQRNGLTLFSPFGKIAPQTVDGLAAEVSEVAVCIKDCGEVGQLREAGAKVFLAKFSLK